MKKLPIQVQYLQRIYAKTEKQTRDIVSEVKESRKISVNAHKLIRECATDATLAGRERKQIIHEENSL